MSSALLTPQNPLDSQGQEDTATQTTTVLQEGWGCKRKPGPADLPCVKE